MAVERKRMLILRGSALEWSLNDIVMLPGELGVQDNDTDTPTLRIGDGVRTFSQLPDISSVATIDYADQAEVDAGVSTDQAVSPSTLSIHLDTQRLSAGQVATGPADAGKAMRLGTGGVIDLSFMQVQQAAVAPADGYFIFGTFMVCWGSTDTNDASPVTATFQKVFADIPSVSLSSTSNRVGSANNITATDMELTSRSVSQGTPENATVSWIAIGTWDGVS